jgi:hypothetical protein
MDRKRYCDELNRELFLQSLGFRVVSFAYDDVAHRPVLCATLLRMLLGRYQAVAAPVGRSALMEKEVIRLAVQLARPIRPIDVEKHFAVSHRTAVSWLAALRAKGWLHPMRNATGEGRQHGKESSNKGNTWCDTDGNCKGKGSGGKVLRYELDRNVWDYID